MDGQLGSIHQVQLPEDMADVGLDGLLADHQRLGDFVVAAALRHQVDDLQLARRQGLRFRRRGWRRRVGDLRHELAGDIRVQTRLAAMSRLNGRQEILRGDIFK